MANRADDLQYPVLCVPRALGPHLVRDPADLQSCEAVLFWRARFYEGLRLIDANGEAYEVVGAEVRKPASSIAQRLARLLGLRIVVDVRARHIGPASLAEVAGAVERAIDDDAETFEEFSGRSVLWWQSELTRCPTVAELMRALSADVKRAED